uniref:Uncharacterized protein n=1 Tax=Globodera rostochiensis TaxID=31243 RepID=A0A914I153_GLORO
MKFTTYFGLRSQTTRLQDTRRWIGNHSLDRSCTFSGAPVKGNLNKQANPSSRSVRYTSRPQRRSDSALDSSQFTRRYYGNPRRNVQLQMPIGEAFSYRIAFFGYDPEPGVPMDVTPMAQCAFESSVFKVSAVHTNYRSWLRSSSIHEPSTGPNTSSHHGHGRSTQAQTCRKAQQPLNDAQTPAQPLGCPVGVLPPLAQRPDDSSNRRLTHRATNIGYTPTLMCPQGAVRTLLVNVPANTQRACVRQQQTEACGVAHTDSMGVRETLLGSWVGGCTGELGGLSEQGG